ncbi:MAG: hydantoinase B/oxoprolinase family protein [Dehalococcoidia bacterium]|nr:hydantoinase B/oxoprolinase family protein [Dehalococcoidia bacterium]
MATTVDPITLEVLNNRLREIVATMEHLLFHGGYSTILRESKDGSCVITDRNGCAVYAGSQLHLTPYHFTLRTIIEQYPPETMREGDSYIANDPYLAGVFHASDVAIVTPIFYRGTHVGFAASIAHKSDIGGMVPGSASGASRELYHEGFIIPCIKYATADGPIEDVVRLLMRNSRQPDALRGDLQSQVGCTRVGAEKIKGLCDEYGLDTMLTAFQELQDVTEARVRQGLRDWPDGEYSAETEFEADGTVFKAPVRFSVRIRKEADGITFDLTGSSPQVASPQNIRPQSQLAAAALSTITSMDPSIPLNYGALRPIKIVSKSGLVTEAEFPAPVGSYFASTAMLYSACLMALSNFNPARAVATSGFGTAGPVLGYKQARSGKPAVSYELMSPSLGGTPIHDGTLAVNPMHQYTPYTPVEILETEYPVRLERVETIIDSAGPGRYRGGLGYRKRYRVLSDCTLNFRRMQPAQPQGIFGGGSPLRLTCTLNPETEGEETLARSAAFELKAGSSFQFQSQGGSGYGDPLTRDPAKVLDDVLDGYVSIAGAERDYGVVIDPAAMAVDERATARRRGK